MKKISLVLALLMLFQSVGFVYATQLTISGNGESTINTIVSEQITTTTVTQNNDSTVTTTLKQTSDSGSNTSEFNIGETSIVTGDTSSNVSVNNEMNVSVVDQNACCGGETELNINDNGNGSSNTISNQYVQQNSVNVNQNATITTSIKGTANTGNNSAIANTGSSIIKTGNVNAAESIINGPINISYIKMQLPSFSSKLDISANGANTYNNISVTNSNVNEVLVNNNAEIKSISDWYLNTGGNKIKWNVGDSTILTGNIVFDSVIKNGPINFSVIDWANCCVVSDAADPDSDNPDDIQVPDGVVIGSAAQSPFSSSSSDAIASVSNGIGGILGLSDTSTANAYNYWFASFLIIVAGLRLINYNSMLESSLKEN